MGHACLTSLLLAPSPRNPEWQTPFTLRCRRLFIGRVKSAVHNATLVNKFLPPLINSKHRPIFYPEVELREVLVCVLDRRLRSEPVTLQQWYRSLGVLIKDEEPSSQPVLLIGSLSPSQFVLPLSWWAGRPMRYPTSTTAHPHLPASSYPLHTYSTEKNIIHHMQRGGSYGRTIEESTHLLLVMCPVTDQTDTKRS